MAIYLYKGFVDERRREEWVERRLNFNSEERARVGRYLMDAGFTPEGNGMHFRRDHEYVGVGSDIQIHIGEGTTQAVFEEVIILAGADYYITDKDGDLTYHPVEAGLGLYSLEDIVTDDD